MTAVLFLGTQRGVVAARKQDTGWIEVSRNLDDKQVTGLIASPGVLFAGTKQGVYRAFLSLDPGGESHLEEALSGLRWELVQDGIGLPHIRSLAPYPKTGEWIFAGTEPAEIYISYDAGDSWRVCPEVAHLREKYGWSLPYSPEAGCVRGFAFHTQRAYAAVEDGCVLVSDDRGETWKIAEGSTGGPTHAPKTGFVHSDVHSIEVHPSSANLVVAPTGGGLFDSSDGGASWNNLYRCYTRAAWINPEDQHHIIFGPADSVDRGGRIEMTQDGGRTWMDASSNLEVPWRSHMVERFVQIDGDLLAVLSNGQVIITSLNSMVWDELNLSIPFVLSAAAIQII
jgi:photosystem II stability/assembly factor-like uncharacterized protein